MVTGGGKQLYTPIKQSQETDSKHSMSVCKLDHIIRNDTPVNMTLKNSLSPTKGETQTRLGQINCRLERFKINM